MYDPKFPLWRYMYITMNVLLPHLGMAARLFHANCEVARRHDKDEARAAASLFRAVAKRQDAMIRMEQMLQLYYFMMTAKRQDAMKHTKYLLLTR